MTNVTYDVKLSAAELQLLDGRCSHDVQQAVNLAKAAAEHAFGFGAHPNSERLSRFVAEVKAEAVERGHLMWQHKSLRSCPLCRKSAGYAKYKSGRNRGQDNWDKPRTFSGYELAIRCVIMQGHATLGCCADCMELCKPVLREALVGIRAQLPEALQTPGETSFERFDRVECTRCAWRGHEGLMGRRPTWDYGGTYPAICPQCKAENAPMGPRLIERIDGFEVVPRQTKAEVETETSSDQVTE